MPRRKTSSARLTVGDFLRLTRDQQRFLLTRPRCDSHREAAEHIGKSPGWLRRQYESPKMRYCLTTMDYDFVAMTRAAVAAVMGQRALDMLGQLQSDDAGERGEAMDFLRGYLPASVRRSIIPDLLLVR